MKIKNKMKLPNRAERRAILRYEYYFNNVISMRARGRRINVISFRFPAPEIKFTKMNIPIKDVMPFEDIVFDTELICNVFGVPKELLKSDRKGHPLCY